MGEVILWLPDGGTQENLLPVAMAESLPWYGRGYKILFSIDPTQGARCAPEDRMEALQTPNRAFWASDCTPICKMRLQSEAARSIPTNRSCRFCDPVSGRCRGLCVRASSPKSGRETPQRHYLNMGFAQARLQADNLSVVRQEVQNASTPAQFHAPRHG
jgi:hypothetical protein